MFWFSLQILPETHLILRGILRDITKNVNSICLHVKHPLLLSDFKETYFSTPIFEKYWNIKFNENLPSGAEVHVEERTSGGRTDRHDEANSRFSQFFGNT